MASISLSRPTASIKRISELVRLACDGQIRVPGFQRGFRWDGSDVLELFDSVWHGYPVGSLLLWERPAPATTIVFGHVAVDAPELADALWVVDGQHRVTAFVAVLAADGSPGGPFELYFDLEAQMLRRRQGPAQPPATWLALAGLLDQNALFARLLALKGEGALTDEQIDIAVDFANRVRDYELPLSTVRTDEERIVRRIFDRVNSTGKRLKASEVFHSLHAAAEGGSGTDLTDVVETIGAAGFGSLQDDTVLRCVLAAGGGDPYRDFRDEFSDAAALHKGLHVGTQALLATISFLQRDAWVAHRLALPYTATLPVLTRFFACFPDSTDQTRQLLRRWVWRGALAWRGGRDVAVVRRAVQGIAGDEASAALGLLAALGSGEIEPIDLRAVQLNRAAARLNLALLGALMPRDLGTGEAIDVTALLDRDDTRPLQQIGPGAGLVGRVLHPPLEEEEIGQLVARADAITLASHAISERAQAALRRGDSDAFASERERGLTEALTAKRADLAEFDASDRPAIDDLVIADESA